MQAPFVRGGLLLVCLAALAHGAGDLNRGAHAESWVESSLETRTFLDSLSLWAWWAADGAVSSFVFFMVVFGQLLGYIPQYKAINAGRGQGFSTLVCFVLIFCNTLRLFFWLGKPFESALAWQSVVMILFQLAMLEAWTGAERRQQPAAPGRKYTPTTIFNGGVEAFWKWHDITSYIAFLGLLVVSLSLVSTIMSGSQWYIEGLGFTALASEAMLGLPQALRNARQRSTAGLSFWLIMSWFLGDMAKSLYFWWKDQPVQFLACGMAQIGLDCVILAQMIWYPKEQMGASAGAASLSKASAMGQREARGSLSSGGGASSRGAGGRMSASVVVDQSLASDQAGFGASRMSTKSAHALL